MERGARMSRRKFGLLATFGAALTALVPSAGLSVGPATGRKVAEGMMQAQPAQAVPITLLLAAEPARSGTRDPVTFVLALDNPGSADATFTFRSGQVYDIVVLSGDVEVWRWSNGMMFGAMLTDRTYVPGVTLLGRERWDWRDANGAPVPPGRYRAVASLVTNPPSTGNVVELTLEAP